MDSKKFMESFGDLIDQLDHGDDVKQSIFNYAASAFSLHGIDCGVSLEVSQKLNRKAVLCVEANLQFCSLMEAAKFLHSNGWPNADRSVLSRAARGVNKKAYGFTWKYM